MPDDMSEFEQEVGDIADPIINQTQRISVTLGAHLFDLAEHLAGHMADLADTAEDGHAGGMVQRANGTTLAYNFVNNEFRLILQFPHDVLEERLRLAKAALTDPEPEWPPQELGGEG